MFGFLVKKNFFDTWDNLFRVALVNIGFLASLAVPVFLPPLFAPLRALELGVLFAGLVWCFVYLSAAALSLKAVSDYGSFRVVDFFANLKAAWLPGIVFGIIAFIGFLLCSVVIPFYLTMKSMTGLLLAAFVFWSLMVGVLAFQFFFAVRARLDTKISKVIKKCFIIFFDNPFFCILSLIHNLLLLAISVFLAFLFPGPAGALLFLDEGLRLRLLKYDWLELNPDADRRKIPWDAILIDEREKTGTRSFKSFIFPWKD